MRIIIKIHKDKDTQQMEYHVCDDNGEIKYSECKRAIADKIAHDLAGPDGSVEYQDCECCKK